MALLGCLASFLTATAANAQEARVPSPYRADSTWFFKGRIGFTNYGGDRDSDPFNELSNLGENTGLGLGLEVGYAFTNRFGLSLMHFSGKYPRIDENNDQDGFPYEQPAYTLIDQNNSSQWIHHFSLMGTAYILPEKRVSPYGYLGLTASLGKLNGDRGVGIGPITGIGLDFYVTDRIGLFLEINGIWSFDDAKLDLADTRSKRAPNSDRGIDASDFDAFRSLGVGLRFNTRSPFVPVAVNCYGPTTLIPDESGRFIAEINPDATQPVELTWDFNGTRVSNDEVILKDTVDHAFPQAGMYTVRVTATNRKSMDTAECDVEVLAPPTCQITAQPTPLNMCTQPLPPVQFRSTVTGAPPITYQWDFGDGGTSTAAEPSHTYTRSDVEPTTLTRTARLTVSNVAGTATCRVDVNIEPCPCNPNLAFGQACFNRNESVIPQGQARQNLQDNLEILRTNPSTLIVVTGFAQPNEANAQGLADDRARAVAQFYIDNGIDASRIRTLGLVTPEGGKTGPVCTQTIPFCDGAARDAYIQQQRQQ